MKYAAVICCMSNLLYDCQTYCQTYCKNVKSCMIEVRTKAKTMLRTWFQIKVRKNSEKSVKFLQVSVSCLQQKVPFNVHLLRNVQFLNPLKRKSGGTTSAISNLALKVTSVLKNVLGSIFQKGSKHAFVDVIRNQWNFINNEENFTCMLCKNWLFLEDWKFSWWIWS